MPKCVQMGYSKWTYNEHKLNPTLIARWKNTTALWSAGVHTISIMELDLQLRMSYSTAARSARLVGMPFGISRAPSVWGCRPKREAAQERPSAMIVEDGGTLDLVTGDFEDDDSDYEGLREEAPLILAICFDCTISIARPESCAILCCIVQWCGTERDVVLICSNVFQFNGRSFAISACGRLWTVNIRVKCSYQSQAWWSFGGAMSCLENQVGWLTPTGWWRISIHL